MWFLPAALALTLASAADKPDLHVLSVGVECYAIAEGKPDIYGQDARRLAQAFEAARPAFGTVHKQVLTGRKADRAGVLAALDEMKQRMRPADVGFVHFSTHGDKTSRKGFYVMLAGSDGDDWRQKVLWGEELAAVGRLPGRVVVTLDTCRAGKFLEVAGDGLGRASVLCACRANESSFGGRRGYYARALEEGLKGKADGDGDGRVTLGELATYAGRRAGSLSEDAQHDVRRLRPGHESLVLSKP